tara:strand:+ start:573 stop:761 length:189 start_codon:yes stop_codon:yes gene_type:complete
MKTPELKSYTQRLFKVGFGPNLWGIISEDSLDKYSNKVGMEYYGERTLYYIPDPDSEEQPQL